MGKEIIIAICQKLGEQFYSVPNKDIDTNTEECFQVTCAKMSEKPEHGGRRTRKYRIKVRFQTPVEDYAERCAFVMDELAELLDSIIISEQKIPGNNFSAKHKNKVLKFYAEYDITFDKALPKAEHMEDLNLTTRV